MTGNVKWWDDRKGYGFITPDQPGPDIFMHHTGWRDGARPIRDRLGRAPDLTGVRVEYDVEQGRKGKQACNVRVIDHQPAA